MPTQPPIESTLDTAVEQIVNRVEDEFNQLPADQQTRDTFRELIYDAVSDELYQTRWFARSRYGAATYGAIIEVLESDPRVDPSEVDTAAVADQPTPTAILESIARDLYETALAAHVIEEASWPTDTDGGVAPPEAA